MHWSPIIHVLDVNAAKSGARGGNRAVEEEFCCGEACAFGGCDAGVR